MKILLPLLLLLTAFSTHVFAQVKDRGVARGKVMDTVSQQSLQDATVEVLNIADSAVVARSITKEDGSFLIENIPFGRFLLHVTFQGYANSYNEFSLAAAKPVYNPGSLFLAPLPKDLGVVVVTSTPPIVVKGDTTEFSASRIKTKPNATADELLKKIPGMEVDKEGAVKAQGEQVTKILVDGKVFF